MSGTCKTTGRLYRRKLNAVIKCLAEVTPVDRPASAFYLWLETPIDDQVFAQELYARHNIPVLSGRLLSRKAHGINPGAHGVRVALVAPFEDYLEATRNIRDFISTLN